MAYIIDRHLLLEWFDRSNDQEKTQVDPKTTLLPSTS